MTVAGGSGSLQRIVIMQMYLLKVASAALMHRGRDLVMIAMYFGSMAHARPMMHTRVLLFNELRFTHRHTQWTGGVYIHCHNSCIIRASQRYIYKP
jgi:hypothetical protein